MAVMNKPHFNEMIQWAYDYYVIALSSHVETKTFYVGGSYNTSTGAYTGGTIVGYVYTLYDSNDTKIVSQYRKKA